LGRIATSVTVLAVLVVFGLSTVGVRRMAHVHHDAAA
jgi:hypothetical protein